MTVKQHSETGSTVMWQPGDEDRTSSRIALFMKWLRTDRSLDFVTYRELWEWSVTDLAGFWQALVDYFDVIGDGLSGTVLTEERMPGTEWFPDATLNYAENILRTANDDAMADKPAITSVTESNMTTHVTWRELNEKVAAVAAALRELGVGRGDRVAAVLPNIAEAVIGLLATASVGAVWSISSPDLSPTATLSRLAQLEPKVLFGTTGYEFKGQYFDRAEHLAKIEAGLPSSVLTVVVGTDAADAPHHRHFDELAARTAEPAYDRVPFSHPLWVLFSSGTTGAPKGIMHGHGGMIIEALKTWGLNEDVGPEDLYYVAANTSWMVWNTLLHALANGAQILLYAGSPTLGRPDRQFELIANHGVTIFATGAAYLSLVEKAGCVPQDEFDFSALRAITSTASPLPVSTWQWVHNAVKADVHLGSGSGGTDICSAFIGSNPLEPVILGQLTGPMLAVSVQSWDESGRPVVDEVGEMVITKPLPSMPVAFWDDQDGQKYRNAYFTRFPGVWTHGDWITETPAGGFIVHGRSDATLNRDGVRLGSADIYNALQHVPEVRDSLVVGVELPDGGYYQPLFVSLTEGSMLSEALEQKIRQTIRQHASARHVPDEIVVAPAVPITHAGKKIEVPIKRLLANPSSKAAVNAQSLSNPESLDWFGQFAINLRSRRDTAVAGDHNPVP